MIFDQPNSLSDYIPLSRPGPHGYDHWQRVCQNGLAIARVYRADEEVVSIFAWLHDACRENDNDDPDHGKRAAELAVKLQGVAYDLGQDQLICLLYALTSHNKGEVETDITVGICWDADRLDLIRVGVIPHPRYMSTDIGKAMARKLRIRIGAELLLTLLMRLVTYW